MSISTFKTHTNYQRNVYSKSGEQIMRRYDNVPQHIGAQLRSFPRAALLLLCVNLGMLL